MLSSKVSPTSVSDEIEKLLPEEMSNDFKPVLDSIRAGNYDLAFRRACSSVHLEVALKVVKALCDLCTIHIDEGGSSSKCTGLHNASLANNFKLCVYLVHKQKAKINLDAPNIGTVEKILADKKVWLPVNMEEFKEELNLLYKEKQLPKRKKVTQKIKLFQEKFEPFLITLEKVLQKKSFATVEEGILEYKRIQDFFENSEQLIFTLEHYQRLGKCIAMISHLCHKVPVLKDYRLTVQQNYVYGHGQGIKHMIFDCKLYLYLHNHCIIFDSNKNKFQFINAAYHISNNCISFAESHFIMKHGDADVGNQFLSQTKKLLPMMETDHANISYTGYYNQKFKLPFSQSDFFKAKQYALKILSGLNRISDTTNRFGHISNLVATFFSMMDLSEKENEDEQALFWARLAKRLLKEAQEILSNPHELIEKLFTKDTIENCKPTLISSIKHISRIKDKLFSKKVNELKSAFSDDTFFSAITAIASEKASKPQKCHTIVLTLTKPGDLPFLINELQKKQIFGYCNDAEQSIKIHLIDVHIPSIIKAVNYCKQEINRKNSQITQNLQEDLRQQTSSLITSTTNMSSSDLISVSAKNASNSSNSSNNTQVKKEKRKHKAQTQPSSQEKQKPPAKIISWGSNYFKYKEGSKNCRVFPFYGPTVHNQFFFHKPELLRGLSQDNPDALSNLKHLYGLVINDSENGKGYIIKGNQCEGRDTSKDYRFFGHKVTSTESEGKTCGLWVIDTFKPTHNRSKLIKY